MTDQNFPIIEYPSGQSSLEWGRMHGESYRLGIRELVEIRLGLMREKNPALSPAHIESLAGEQWSATQYVAPELTDELKGIAEGSGLSAEHIVVLNNYTDFRDIQLPDEGCSAVFVNQDSGPIAGQTWDMHGSAKNYVCCLKVPVAESDASSVLFTLVGCVGMMGYSPFGTMVGVNNINTNGATAGTIWPAVVRNTLCFRTHEEMARHLTTAQVTSGHNYLIASEQQAEMWEVMPGLSERVDFLSTAEEGYLFHTNHCLGEQTILREHTISQNSTSHTRYELLEHKLVHVRTFEDVYELLNDHENYPRSICSNYQANSQDPSITCGGAVGHLATGRVEMWRGDPEHDANFKRHAFQLTPA